MAATVSAAMAEKGTTAKMPNISKTDKRILIGFFNVSICNFDNRYNEEKWNSFIVGTSRSRYWEISDWEKLPIKYDNVTT